MEISSKALFDNASRITQYVKCPVIGVLKCDGYGVSVLAAAKAWQASGVTMFAVSDPADAIALRDAEFKEDILLLSPVSDSDTFGKMRKAKVILPVTSTQIAEFYRRQCGAGKVRVHIAVDTGMGRFGFRWTEKDDIKNLYDTSCFQVEGIYSHFSAAFEKRYNKTRMQANRFLSVTEYLRDCGCSVGIRHIAGSCAALRFPETRLDAVRIGSALIGRSCCKVPLVLAKVGWLKAQVMDVKTLLPGDCIGYGAICKVNRECKVAVVALGTENGCGYCRTAENFPIRCMPLYLFKRIQGRKPKMNVCYQDHNMPLIGRIGTQFSVFDATGTNIRPGDYVSCDVNLLFPHKRRRFV